MGKKRKRASYGHEAILNVDTDDNNGYHEEQPPLDGAYRYNFHGDMPWDLQKYWRQRYDMFSRYNEGIWMTEDAWFEVTPESIASNIARHITTVMPEGKSIILDAFCGVGGNTIAFALSGKFKRVYAIEKNEAALVCAKHNAEVYGVADKITWFHGDCFEILGVDASKKQNAVGALQQVIKGFGVIFASPPWGGPGYKTAEVFDLSQMQPYSLDDIHDRFRQVTENVVLYLPRTSDLNQIAAKVKDDQQAEVVHYCTNGHSRALCIFYGEWLRPRTE